MKKLIITLSFLLLSVLVYSQIGYPKRIVYNGDTVIVITEKQMDALYLEHLDKDRYKEMSDSLSTMVTGYKLVVIDQKNLESLLRNDLTLKEEKILARDGLLAVLKERLAKVERQLLWTRIGVGGLIVLCVVLAL